MDCQLIREKYKNVAIDESHEMCINRKLKEITTHAFEYRTVNLAPFMAYLDGVMRLIEKKIFKFVKPRADWSNKTCLVTNIFVTLY